MANQRIGYRDAVARQPESLEIGRQAVETALAGLDLSGFSGRSVGFAGIGASYQAALAGAIYLRRLGTPAFAYVPTDLYDTVDSAAEAFVALSASGQSREIADVMTLRPTLPRIAVCRSPGTPLGAITGLELGYESGADNGASSTGYTGMLLAIGMLADKLAGRGSQDIWRRLPGLVAEVLRSQVEASEAAAERLANRNSLDIVGAGAAFATAGEAAMLIREAVRVPAQGWDTLNYLHGPMESQDGGTGVIALGRGREMKIAADMPGFGIASVLVTSATDIPSGPDVVIKVPDAGNEVAQAILDIVAVQMVVGVMQDAANLTNITFRYRQTDTKLKPWSPTEV
jgi:glucosamine--fructose-6-phosphate aminotransferase (isomerizing)